MDAEYARVQNKSGAGHLYQEAAGIAEQQCFTLYASHIHEQAAKTLSKSGRIDEANALMAKALAGYQALGWNVKADAIFSERNNKK